MEMRWLAHQSICQGERQTSFLQMHPSDKTCRIRAAVNLSESYFWIYYNQPCQLISYLQHINEPGKDKYIKPCQTWQSDLFLSHEGCISLQFYINSWVKAVQLAWPLLLEDLNGLPNHLNGLNFFIFGFSNWDTLKGVIFRRPVVSRVCKSRKIAYMSPGFSRSGEKGESEIQKLLTRVWGIQIKHQLLPQSSCPSPDKPHLPPGRWRTVLHLLHPCLVPSEDGPAASGGMQSRVWLEPCWWQGYTVAMKYKGLFGGLQEISHGAHKGIFLITTGERAGTEREITHLFSDLCC